MHGLYKCCKKYLTSITAVRAICSRNKMEKKRKEKKNKNKLRKEKKNKKK